MKSLSARHLHELVQSLSVSLDVPIELTDERLNRVSHSVPGVATVVHAVSPRHLGLSPSAVASLSEPTLIPANDVIGMSATLVIPLRSTAMALLGLLWVTCAHGELSSDRVSSIRRIADATMLALEEVGQLNAPKWEAEGIGRAFAAGDLAATDGLLDNFVRRGELQNDGAFVCVALSIPEDLDADVPAAATQHRLKAVMNRFAESYPEPRRLIAQSGSTSFALVAPLVGDANEILPEKLAARVSDLIFRSRPSGDDAPWLVATSSIVRGRPSAAVWQAREGLEIGRKVGWKHKVVNWQNVAHLRGIAALPTEILRQHFVSPPLEWLIADETAETLVETLRAFLVTAGNVKQIAAESFLHRTTVYYRLKQLEDRLGVDLADGNARLEVHVGLIAHDVLRRRAGGPTLGVLPNADV